MNITKTDANTPALITQTSAPQPEESKVSAAVGPVFEQAAQEMPTTPPREFTDEFNRATYLKYNATLLRLIDIKKQLEDRHEVLIRSLEGRNGLRWDDLALSGLETIENMILHTISTYYVLKKRDADHRLQSMSWSEYFLGGSNGSQTNDFSQLKTTYDSYAEAFQKARKLRDPSSNHVRSLQNQYHENSYSVRTQPITPTFVSLEGLGKVLSERFGVNDLDASLFIE